MKKFIFATILVLATIMSANAQSFQYHQGYDFKSEAPSQKFIADFFWTNDTWNVFSWNNFGVNYDSAVPGSTDATALLYVERKLGNTNFYLHPEVRLNTWCENYYQIGFAYLLPFENVGIYLTPKYSYHDRHDFQFSINSSFENDAVYYEGYLDTDWVPAPLPLGLKADYAVGFFTEQKVYWKATERLHFGVNLVAGGDTKNGFYTLAPMFTTRVSLY